MKDYTQITKRERQQIYACIDRGKSAAEIAKRISRYRSTIYREIKRNKINAIYLPGMADEKARARRQDQRPLKIEMDKKLYDYVTRHLALGWSPEQISGRLKRHKKKHFICHETICRYIYRKKDLYHYLRYKQPKRRKQPRRKSQYCRYGDKRLITQRPARVESRRYFGHWEGDGIEFSGSKQKTVTTLIERKSRFVFLIKNQTKVSAHVMGNIKDKMALLTKKSCRTITFDQGSEFADYRQIENQMACRIYYCHARSPWEKGSNENMNGRLRAYLPRSQSVETITQEALDGLVEKMNNIPRKCLDYSTPREVYLRHC